jgi:peptidoglycan hydrolase-like protein with peptidoglycan-binding domain
MTLAVGNILRSRGVNVVYTRTRDEYVSLANRVQISNNTRPDMFVSLHRNSAINPEANGFENYTSPNASAKSKQWARTVYDSVADTGVFPTLRGLKEANYYVLKNTAAPAQLLELGFISNEADNQRFDANFDALAQSIADGILTDLNVEPGPTPPTPTHRDRVRAVQQTLNDIYNQGLAADGIVGPVTRRALLRALQLQLNVNGTQPPLTIDGIWGAKTRSAVPLVRLGNSGNIVWLVQAALIAKGYNIAADGRFGPATKSTLIDFQRANGLSPDGIAGPATFERLFA